MIGMMIPFSWPESRENIPTSGLPYSRRDVKNKQETRGDRCGPSRGKEAVSNFFFFWGTIQQTNWNAGMIESENHWNIGIMGC
jgi:hypothetical protein